MELMPQNNPVNEGPDIKTSRHIQPARKVTS